MRHSATASRREDPFGRAPAADLSCSCHKKSRNHTLRDHRNLYQDNTLVVVCRTVFLRRYDHDDVFIGHLIRTDFLYGGKAIQGADLRYRRTDHLNIFRRHKLSHREHSLGYVMSQMTVDCTGMQVSFLGNLLKRLALLVHRECDKPRVLLLWFLSLDSLRGLRLS